MQKPCLTLQHLKTSRQYDDGSLIFRHWFQWSERKNLKSIVVRVQLLDKEQNQLTEGSFQLKKTIVRNYLYNDEGKQQPVYDTNIWLQLDDIVREEVPAFFRYYTVEGVGKKSESITVEMSGLFEDLEQLG